MNASRRRMHIIKVQWNTCNDLIVQNLKQLAVNIYSKGINAIFGWWSVIVKGRIFEHETECPFLDFPNPPATRRRGSDIYKSCAH